jgi:mRNA-decapping enzyme subunit 2
MSSYKSFHQALFEVEARFLNNLPDQELDLPERLFFHIEQAYWYFEDFYVDRYPNLQHVHHLKLFAKAVFHHAELLKTKQHEFDSLYSRFTDYKAQIPVCGCILLNTTMTKVVLVCDWHSSGWMFPRGKINQHEKALQCAIRETKEETGFDASLHCNESDVLTVWKWGQKKKMQLFIACDVPEDTFFVCKTRKEVSDIQFFPIDQLPTKRVDVDPFSLLLTNWIVERKRSIEQKGTEGETTDEDTVGELSCISDDNITPTNQQTDVSTDEIQTSFNSDSSVGTSTTIELDSEVKDVVKMFSPHSYSDCKPETARAGMLNNTSMPRVFCSPFASPFNQKTFYGDVMSAFDQALTAESDNHCLSS